MGLLQASGEFAAPEIKVGAFFEERISRRECGCEMPGGLFEVGRVAELGAEPGEELVGLVLLDFTDNVVQMQDCFWGCFTEESAEFRERLSPSFEELLFDECQR